MKINEFQKSKSCFLEPIKWGKFLIIDSQELEENTFGILISSSEIFQKPFEGKPELAEKNVLAETALHNYL